MHAPQTIHLGGQTRSLVVTPKALRVAQRLLGGKDPRIQLLTEGGLGSLDVIVSCAAAALVHEMGDKADPGRIEKWIEREPLKYPELHAVVLRCYVLAYQALGVIPPDDEDPAQGKEAPPPSPAQPGS